MARNGGKMVGMNGKERKDFTSRMQCRETTSLSVSCLLLFSFYLFFEEVDVM